ncbi:hypothetical protein IC229_09390 [Spirosoma sp. BT702]|uniref:Uncharacterized protein n=1 Tax=Spirosoma profusum TaxID=2771354 RepID=A0A926Y2J5_9BACT|nr:hypothetical protein [Spirosoma profusum]MBD2700851.1 hypothetical protein [Spirosoma profusum]
MANSQSLASQVQSPAGQIKQSIRDMVRLQQDYQLSDELFWEVFDRRVLLNKPVDIDLFLRNLDTPIAQS